MTFRHLECALEVAHSGSISRAAKNLLVSQPYLSGMINALEKEIGYQLFIRNSKGISCTPQGTVFLEHASTIMSELHKIRTIGQAQEFPLNIATYYSRFITEHFIAFHALADDAPEDRCREMGNMEVVQAIAGRTHSLGIIYHAKTKAEKFRKLAEENNLVYHTLFEKMGTYVIMGKTHPLAKKEDLEFDELRGCPTVFFDDESTTLYMMEHLKLERTSKHFGASDRGTFMDALNSGRYLSVINTPYPRDEMQFVLKKLPDELSPEIDFNVMSAYLTHKDHTLTAREKDFLRYLLHEMV